jgi:uncharacterized protein YgiM (DUF1202 family)
MKRIIIMFVLCACIAAAAFSQAVRNGTMYVATKTLALKSSTGLFAGTTGTLQYGAQVTVLQVNGNWVQVRATVGSSVSGWTKTANLTAKRVIASSAAGATASEIALAGKGFNEEVENAYKSGGTLNYADVDKTEAQQVSDEELQTFLREGRLSMGDK